MLEISVNFSVIRHGANTKDVLGGIEIIILV